MEVVFISADQLNRYKVNLYSIFQGCRRLVYFICGPSTGIPYFGYQVDYSSKKSFKKNTCSLFQCLKFYNKVTSFFVICPCLIIRSILKVN